MLSFLDIHVWNRNPRNLRRVDRVARPLQLVEKMFSAPHGLGCRNTYALRVVGSLSMVTRPKVENIFFLATRLSYDISYYANLI